MQKRWILPVALIVALIIGFVGGVGFDRARGDRSVTTSAIQPSDVDLSQFWDVWNLLEQKFVDRDKLKRQDMIYGAIAGLVESLGDPYTVFLPPKQSEAFAQEIKGSFGGVGIEIGKRNDVLTVIAPIENTPAARAGILAGDKIIKIDDKITDGISVSEAVNMIRGNKGTTVTLTINRNGSELKEFKLVRGTIKVPSVTWKPLDGGVAHLKVHVFNQNVDSAFKNATHEILNSGASKIILDLRNNPGGLLDSAVNLAGYFQPSGQIVTIERFGDGRENIFRSSGNGQLKHLPVVILINKGSASASEILAGSLRDNRGVTIIGETSFGKGSVQEVAELSRGSSLKITVAKWFTPKGTSINENGIKPDVEVLRSEDDINQNRDPQLDKAVELIKNL